jgi:hypothetical protein
MALQEEADRLCRELGSKDALQRWLGHQALILQGRGDLDRAVTLCRVLLEDTEFDLQCRDALVAHVDVEAGLACRGLRTLARWHPAVAVAEQDDEERTAALDLAQADLEHADLARFLIGRVARIDAEAQIDRLEEMPPRPQPLLQLGEDEAAQAVTFRLHVAEGAADEDRSRDPGRRHRFLNRSAVRLSQTGTIGEPRDPRPLVRNAIVPSRTLSF